MVLNVLRLGFKLKKPNLDIEYDVILFIFFFYDLQAHTHTHKFVLHLVLQLTTSFKVLFATRH